jgi:hypothetical protein
MSGFVMNDSREFALALDIARQELGRRIDKASSEEELKRLKLLRDKIYTIERVNICVCSFSELGDTLSQWRGYGGGKAGFSVGFSREWFARLKDTFGFSILPCVYDLEEQRLIQEKIDKILATDTDSRTHSVDPEADYWDNNRGYEDPKRPRTFVVLPNAGNDFARRLAEIAPLIKDESFADEREWRLVSRPIAAADLEHRPGETMIIPYYSIPIGSEDVFTSVSEIVVGPTPHPELSAGSLRSLMLASEFTGKYTFTTASGSGTSVIPPIRHTRIPFRNW